MKNTFALVGLPLLMLHSVGSKSFIQSASASQEIGSSRSLLEQKTELATRQPIASFAPGSSQVTAGGSTPASQSRVSPPIQVAQASLNTISGTLTNIQGTAERMISYRHQQHMWLTDDGAMHIVVNLGNDNPGSSLMLYSSFDQGKSWNQMFAIPNTNSNTTSDGFLIKNTLKIVYSSSQGKVLFGKFNYDPTTKSWSNIQSSPVFEGTNYTAERPSLIGDLNRYMWVSFVARDKSTGHYFIRLYNSVDKGVTWTNTTLNLGNVSASTRKSANLVFLGDRVGAVYTNNNTINWAYRMNDWPINTPWQSEVIFQHTAGSHVDRYASHFSVAVDQQKNLHLVSQNQKRLLYLRFNQQTQTWDTPKIFSGDSPVNYMQVSTSLNKVLILANIGSNIALYQSSDYGDNFSLIKLLQGPPNSSLGASSSSVTEGDGDSQARMEAPGSVKGTLPVLLQFEDNGKQRLVYFNVQLETQLAESTNKNQSVPRRAPIPVEPPVVPDSDIDKLSCYMQSNGRTFDLNYLCR